MVKVGHDKGIGERNHDRSPWSCDGPGSLAWFVFNKRQAERARGKGDDKNHVRRVADVV